MTLNSKQIKFCLQDVEDLQVMEKKCSTSKERSKQVKTHAKYLIPVIMVS